MKRTSFLRRRENRARARGAKTAANSKTRSTAGPGNARARERVRESHISLVKFPKTDRRNPTRARVLVERLAGAVQPEIALKNKKWKMKLQIKMKKERTLAFRGRVLRGSCDDVALRDQFGAERVLRAQVAVVDSHLRCTRFQTPRDSDDGRGFLTSLVDVSTAGFSGHSSIVHTREPRRSSPTHSQRPPSHPKPYIELCAAGCGEPARPRPTMMGST